MDLACNICMESYTTIDPRRPRSLPCGHTLCEECASKLFTNGKIRCPTCQQIYTYKIFKDITINRELEDVIDRLALLSTESGPKLHHGKCEEHGNYKVHFCITHDMFMCSDCVVAYHLDSDCRRVSIGKVLHDRKAELTKGIESRIFSLKAADKYLIDTECKIKANIVKLKSELKKEEQLMIRCQNRISNCKTLTQECENRQKHAHNLKSFRELDRETQWMNSSENSMQELTTECLGSILPPGTFDYLSFCRETFVSHTHQGQKRYGRILTRDGQLLLQDFRIAQLAAGSLIINLTGITNFLPSPRQVYLVFSINGVNLGKVCISVNEKEPRRAEQFVTLCVGHKGARYSGTNHIAVWNKGKTAEYFWIRYYLTSKDEPSKQILFSDLEKSETTIHKHGLVISNAGGDTSAGFSILTNRNMTIHGMDQP